MRCDECRYFFPFEDKGACRRKPPVLINTVQTGFPTVLPDWFCGEYQPKPTDDKQPANVPITPITSFGEWGSRDRWGRE
jgi:hypothetical protein